MDNCDLCVATVIYETDGLGNCTSTLAADGYYSDGIYKRNFVSGVFTGPCELCNPTPTPTVTPTTTPTPTPTTSCGVTLISTTYVSGTTWSYNFTTAGSCGTLFPEYSSDNITWTSGAAGGCVSPRSQATGINSGTIYFRMTLFCPSLTAVSNVITYVFPTLTPTPTRTQTPTPTRTQTPTPTSPAVTFCVCYTVSYDGPPSGFYIGVVNFSYVNCSGVTVNSAVGDGTSGSPTVRDVCAQENSIVITGGDTGCFGSGSPCASWFPSFDDCCAPPPTPTPTPTIPAVVFSLRSNTSLVSGNACSLSLTTNCWITPNYGRVFTNSAGTAPFNGQGRIWHLQLSFDLGSISAVVSSTGFIISPAFCSPI
jgi:hypothetical protein